MKQKKMLLGWLFASTFFYALMAMIISRELIIPHFFSEAMGGNIPGDPSYYHFLATEQVQTIREVGFSEFVLRPNGQGIAGVASLAYLLYESPYSVVVVNAFLHAVSTIMMMLILWKWFPARRTLVAVVPLAISPYMMVWFSQLNKDSLTLTGVLLFMYGLIQFVTLGNKSLLRCGFRSFLLMFSGILCLWVNRPYLNQILLPLVAFVLTLTLLLRTIGSYRPLGRAKKIFFIYGLTIIFCLGVLGKGAASDNTIDSFYSYSAKSETSTKSDTKKITITAACLEKIDIRTWKNAGFLPDVMNDRLKEVMAQRCLIFTLLETQHNPTTLSSIVDYDKLPSGSLEALSYLPRAFLLGVFSPWPDNWGFVFSKGTSVFYTIVPLEALLLYAGFVSLGIWLWRNKEWTILIPIGMSVGVMTVYAMATPFIGALYRYRYPWWMLLICLGVSAFMELTKRRSREG